MSTLKKVFQIILLQSVIGFSLYGDHPQAPSREDLCKDIYNSYECAKRVEQEWFKILKGKVFRKNTDELVMVLNNRKKIIRRDTPGEFQDFEDASGNVNEKFSFMDYLEKQQYYLLEITYYEGGSYQFISSETGTSKDISGLGLVFSPKKDHFLIYDMDSLYAEEDQRIQIWTITHQGIRKLWEFKPETWPFFDISWRDSETIEVFTSDEASKNQVIAEIRKKGETWEVSPTIPVPTQ